MLSSISSAMRRCRPSSAAPCVSGAIASPVGAGSISFTAAAGTHPWALMLILLPSSKGSSGAKHPVG